MIPKHPNLEMDRWYGLFHGLARVCHQSFFRGTVTGLEYLPRSGGYLVASNHMSHLDPPVVGQFLPTQVAFFARKTLWTPGVAAWWLEAVGTIPVDRDGGMSLDATKRVLRALEAGRAVIVFPEGTRSADGKLQPPKPGVGLLACKAQVPVVPARVFGSFEAFPKGGPFRPGNAISVAFGPSLPPSVYDVPSEGKERYARAAQRIMDAVARLSLRDTPVI
jgi:1-acyl-sn-glycerol-3-phosphate acyltransferase